MKKILCYGDSNTFGFNPKNGGRYDKTTRWSGILSDLLKEKYEVIYDESLDKLGVLIPNRNYLGIRHSALEHIFKKYENISILTKEQYMKNCYLVERKKEC